MRFSKLAISIALIGFLLVGVALLTNHSGFAQRVTSYIFFMLIFAVFYGTFFEKNKS